MLLVPKEILSAVMTPIRQKCPNACCNARVLMQQIQTLESKDYDYAEMAHIRFFAHIFRFAACFATSRFIIYSMHKCELHICCIVLLRALTNVLKLNVCRVDTDSEMKGIFSDCLASAQFRC
jgi:hypothetical protein